MGHHRPLVVLLDVDDTLAALATRSALEYFGCDVRYVPVASASQLAAALRAVPADTRLLVLSAHGDARGLLLPPLDPDLARLEPAYPVADAAALAALGPWPAVPLLAAVCEFGRRPIVEALHQAGCPAVIAPRGAPDGDVALLFTMQCSYWYLVKHRALPDAVERARGWARAAQTFRLWASPARLRVTRRSR